MIFLDNVWKRFGRIYAVQGVSLEVNEGEVFGYLGPNGAGKTTTIRIISTLLKPDEGYVEVGGISALEMPEKVREIIGVLPENVNLYENLTGEENLLFFAKVFNLPKSVAEERIREYLEFFGLEDRKNDLVGKYSKGMKKRLALARAMLHNPRVLLLDEPTSGLSPEVALEVEGLIKRLSERENITIFLSTHNLDLAERLCDRIGIIINGKLVLVEETRKVETFTSEVIIKIRQKARNYENILEKWSYQIVENQIILKVVNYSKEVPKIIKDLVQNGAEILEVYPKRETLWDVYMRVIRGG